MSVTRSQLSPGTALLLLQSRKGCASAPDLLVLCSKSSKLLLPPFLMGSVVQPGGGGVQKRTFEGKVASNIRRRRRRCQLPASSASCFWNRKTFFLHATTIIKVCSSILALYSTKYLCVINSFFLAGFEMRQTLLLAFVLAIHAGKPSLMMKSKIPHML